MLFASDLINFVLAVLLGIPIILLPGFAVGWLLDLLDFRTLPAPSQWALSCILGISTIPILWYLVFKYLSVAGIWTVLVLLSALSFHVALRAKSFLRWQAIPRSVLVGIILCLIVTALCTLDFTVGSRLYPSAVIVDQSYRSQVIASLAHNSVAPPWSYFYFPGSDVSLKYHYFLFLPGALIERLGFGLVTSHAALSALSVWVEFSLMAVLATLLRVVFPERQRNALNCSWFLLLAGGLDVLPVGAEILRRAIAHEAEILPFPDVEWWNGWGQVFSWIDTAVWQPHHLAALVGLVTACLLLWHSRNQSGRKRWCSVAGASLACASASGMSIYVTAVFAAFLLIVTLEVTLNAPRNTAPLFLTAVFTAVLLLPFWRELQSGSAQPAPFSFGISVRPFLPINLVLNAFGVKSALAWNLTYLAVLPLNFLIEFGVLFVGGIGFWLSHRRSSGDIRVHLLGGLLLLSLILTTFIWSGNAMSNDFGYRGILPAQFVLLVFASLYLSDEQLGSPALSTASRTTLILGVGTTLLGVVMMRGVVGITDAGVWPHFQTLRFGHSAERLFDLRTAYAWLRAHSSESAVVQENPSAWQTLAQGQYSERRTAVFGTLISDTRDQGYQRALDEVSALFEPQTNASSRHQICTKYKITYLVVQDCDQVWHQRNSFVWTTPPALATTHVRVFACE